MPADRFVLNAEVSVAFSDEDIEEHVREQTAALKALYLATKQLPLQPVESGSKENPRKSLQFVVKRGLQVVGVASYEEETGHISDVAIRPTAASDRIGETLLESVRNHAKKLGQPTTLIVNPCSTESRELFRSMGFVDSAIDEAMITQID